MAPLPRSGLAAEVEALDQLSAGQVLLEERSLEELRASLERFDRALRAHLAEARTADGALSATTHRAGRRGDRSADEHRHFSESLEQLWWFFGIVEANDHGGNRQALGQYGRLLAESVRWHLEDERAPGPERPGGRRTVAERGSPRKP